MAKKLTGKQVKKLIERDNKDKTRRERDRFEAWWKSELLDARNPDAKEYCWSAWKARAGVKS